MSRRKRYTRNLGRSLPEPLPVRTTAEWVRFEHAREPYGVFCYLPDAREARPELTAQIDALYDWFNFYLTGPHLPRHSTRQPRRNDRMSLTTPTTWT